MVHYAMFLNRTTTEEHVTIFQIMYSVELIICIYMCIVSPLSMYVSFHAEPLHRNLRLALVYIVSHGVTGFAPRIILIYVQYFCEDFTELETLLTVCSILRRTMMCFLMYILFWFTVDRLIATFYWSWYEREGASTLLSAAVMLAAPEIGGLWSAKLLTYNISSSDSSLYAKYSSIVFLAISVAGGCILFLFLLRYNKQALRNLQRRSNFNKYSLNHTYQLKENLAIMQLAANVAIPAFIWTSPAFLFIGIFRALPEKFMLTRQISIALYDIWIGVTAATAVTAFPFYDHRFRKAVARIPLIRKLLPAHYRHSPHVMIKSNNEKMKDNVNNTDAYFNMLNKDLA